MKRRANGEGSIFQRKCGSWEAQCTIKQLNGLSRRVYFSGKTCAIVKKKLKTAQEREEQGLQYSGKNWTVGDYLDYWMQNVQSGRISDNTRVQYTRMIKIHLKPTLGGHHLANLSVSDVRKALGALDERGFGGAVRQKILLVLSSCLSCAVREELIHRNVAKLVEKPVYTPKETTIWTKEQAAYFLNTVKDHRHYVAFLMLFAYGMRRGEILGLRWGDIDFDNGLIHIRQQIDRIDGVIKGRKLKTKNSFRSLPLVDTVRLALLNHAAKHGITITPFNQQHEFSITDTIVLSNTGKPLESRWLGPCFQQLAKKAGLPRIKLHAIRHTTATILKDLNVPIKDVQLILGHANISTTMNIYQHGTPETHHNAINDIGNQLVGIPQAVSCTEESCHPILIDSNVETRRIF